MKQFNGYFGCGKCKEPGKQLMIGVGKKNVQVHILVYPFYEEHAINPLVHAPVRVHEEMKKQALETMSMQENGKSKMSEVVLCFMPIINSKYSQSNSIVLDYCTFILLLCLKKQNMINLVLKFCLY